MSFSDPDIFGVILRIYEKARRKFGLQPPVSITELIEQVSYSQTQGLRTWVLSVIKSLELCAGVVSDVGIKAKSRLLRFL